MLQWETHGERLHKPILLRVTIISWSSSRVQSPFLIDGSIWLYHLSRHCLPMWPGMRSAIADDLVIPIFMQSIIVRSSLLDHFPLISPGLKTLATIKQKVRKRLVLALITQPLKIQAKQKYEAKRKITHLLPTMETLNIAPLSTQILNRNSFPVPRTHNVDTFAQLLVFICFPSSLR